MSVPPDFLSFLPLMDSIDTTTIETRVAYNPVTKTYLPETVIGKNKGPNSIPNVASTIQLPIAIADSMTMYELFPISANPKTTRTKSFVELSFNLSCSLGSMN